MGTSHSGHKHDASEGSEIVTIDLNEEFDKYFPDLSEGIRSFCSAPTCNRCQYFLETTECVSGDNYMCVSIGYSCEKGVDLGTLCTPACPYFVKKEQP